MMTYLAFLDGYKQSSKYISLCSALQSNVYRFETILRSSKDDIIFTFG